MTAFHQFGVRLFSGIGLSLSQQIIRLHGRSVDCNIKGFAKALRIPLNRSTLGVELSEAKPLLALTLGPRFFVFHGFFALLYSNK
jgi:signal transduction histidine kinase